MQLHLEFGKHWIGHWHNMAFHMDTILSAWMVMLFLILISLVITKKLCRLPDSIQTAAEIVMEFAENIALGQIGEKEGRKHIPLIASLFLFILAANLFGQLPWRLYPLPVGELSSPTNDLNTTVALALVVTLYYMGAGLSKRGFKYFKHYTEPIWFITPMNIMEDFTRPLSLSLRLFANILSGEIMVMILAGFVPLILPVPLMLFELFIAFIQAFIFAILAASYIAAATGEGH